MNINRRTRKGELFLKEFSQEPMDRGSIFSRVPVLFFPPMPLRIHHNDYENYETEAEENDHPGLTFPDLPDAICKLGPIHVAGQYTLDCKK